MNFTKYLVGKDGKVIQRFESKVTPDSPTWPRRLKRRWTLVGGVYPGRVSTDSLLMTLADAWLNQVAPEDYEEHMTRIGQAQANASLVEELMAAAAPPAGARVVIAGAGTGQVFDYLPPAVSPPGA